MSDKFKHLSNAGNFPGTDNINVYKNNQDIDYSVFDNTQMTIKLCHVPWDLGEVHVGQRVIGGIGNVAYFETKQSRDAYFDKLDGFTWQTKYRLFHDEDSLRIPVPYPLALEYNYLIIDYTDLPVEYYGSPIFSKAFYFVRELKAESNNSTTCSFMRDIWQTAIYDTKINYMMLERGSAPLAEITPAAFLDSPLDAPSFLTCEDLNFDNAVIDKNDTPIIINDSSICVIATTSDITASWTDNTPAITYAARAYPDNMQMLGVNISDLENFITYINTNIPQFLQTVEAFYIVPKKLVNTSKLLTINGITVYSVSTAGIVTVGSYTLNEDDFNIPEKYKNLTKLYTSPYHMLRVSTDYGIIGDFKIQDCSKTMTVHAGINNIINGLNITAYIDGVNGATLTSITGKAITDITAKIGSGTVETIMRWNIPCFALGSSSENYDLNVTNKFNYIQQQLSIDNTYASSIESADNSYTNSILSADTSYNNSIENADTTYSNAITNANASYNEQYETSTRAYNISAKNASTAVSNTNLQIAYNDAATTQARVYELQTYSHANIYDTAMFDAAIILARDTKVIQEEEQQATTAITNNGTAISSTIGAVSSFAGAAGSALTGNIVGAVSGVVAGISTFANGCNSISMANASLNIAINALESNYTANKTYNYSSYMNNEQKMGDDLDSAYDHRETLNTLQNNLTDAVSDNNYSMAIYDADQSRTLTRTNASTALGAAQTTAALTKSTSYDVAKETQTLEYTTAKNIKTLEYDIADYNKDTGENAIINQKATAKLQKPLRFGAQTGGTGTDEIIPQFVNFSIIGQSKSALTKTGNEWLKYGYMVNDYWEFDGNYNVMPKWTYWKCSDISMQGAPLPDYYMDTLRMLLMGGVTVWKNPDDIGKVTIFDNV